MQTPPLAPTPERRGAAALLRGTTVALAGSVLGGGLGFVFSVVLARLLAPEDFGLMVLALNLLVAGAALALGGADYAAIRWVAAAATPGEKRGAMLTPLGLALAVNLVLAALVALLAEPIATRLLAQPDFVGPLRALALVLPLTVLAQMLAAALSGLEQVHGEFARKLVEQSGRIVLAPAGIAAGLGVVGAVLGMAAAAAAAAAVVGLLLVRALPRGGRTRPIPLRDVVGFSWPQTVANSAAQLAPLSLVIVLARVEDAAAVALFGAALTVARLPSLIYNAFSYRFSPAISRLHSSGRTAELAETLKDVTRWVTLGSVPLYAVAIALPGALLALFGEVYAEAAATLSILALSTLLNALAGPVEWALIMTGRVRLEMLANLASLATVLVAVVLLAPRFGLVGAALASVAGTIVMNGLKIGFVRRALGMQAFSRGMLPPLLSALVAGAAAAAAGALTGLGGSVLGAVVLGGGLVLLYGVLVVRVFGISTADREAVALALRPSG